MFGTWFNSDWRKGICNLSIGWSKCLMSTVWMFKRQNKQQNWKKEKSSGSCGTGTKAGELIPGSKSDTWARRHSHGFCTILHFSAPRSRQRRKNASRHALPQLCFGSSESSRPNSNVVLKSILYFWRDEVIHEWRVEWDTVGARPLLAMAI